MPTYDALQHPSYLLNTSDWKKWRSIADSGSRFLEDYMVRFSAREQDEEFKTRKAISYIPAFSKAAIREIQNAIFQRMADVVRTGGDEVYRMAVGGLSGGVDLNGNSMMSFIGNKVLAELLFMGKVGVFVDSPPLESPGTIAETRGIRPYLYPYATEDIYNWTTDPKTGLFTRLLLRDIIYPEDPDTGLPISLGQTRYRFIKLTPLGVEVSFAEDNGDVIKAVLLPGLKRIPFVQLELSHSLLTDVADYQIAMLNMASSDVNYSVRANFPLYTEQHDFRIDSPHLVPQAAGSKIVPNTESGIKTDEKEPGTAASAGATKSAEIALGIGRGRRYPKGMERPGFIHPSAEPLLASIAKQDRMKSEIRQLVHLSVSNLSQKMASAESKSYDERGLESGLSAIGLVLERAERQIAEIWSVYNKTKPAHVQYPSSYSLKSDEDRLNEAEKYKKLTGAVGSKVYQKEMQKVIARTLLGGKIPPDRLAEIDREVEATLTVITDEESLLTAVEDGVLSADTCGKIMGFPDGEAEKAKKEHAERLARIAETQTSPEDARGARDEKRASKDKTGSDDIKDRQRGKGRGKEE